MPPRGEETRGQRSDLLRIQCHGSVTWQPARTWGTSIICWLMKSELFGRSLNVSASLLLSAREEEEEDTFWWGGGAGFFSTTSSDLKPVLERCGF